MEYYENHLKSKTHNSIFIRLNIIWKYFDNFKDDINSSNLNGHVKKQKAILSNADSASQADSASHVASAIADSANAGCATGASANGKLTAFSSNAFNLLSISP